MRKRGFCLEDIEGAQSEERNIEKKDTDLLQNRIWEQVIVPSYQCLASMIPPARN